jgi:type I restriction-modification system DNA methylase subunit
MGNENLGQYFTSNNVTNMMANIIINPGDIKPGHILTIYDLCCGSGGMLINAAGLLKIHNYNYQRNAFFKAKDIDLICCYMTFIQLSLLVMSAIIICGNSLTNTISWKRETFFYHYNNVGEMLKLQEEK